MKKYRFSLFLAALAALASQPASAQTATTVYFSSASDVNQYTPPGPVSNIAHLPFVSSGLVFDTSGNLFVAGDHVISKITPGGTVSHFADLPFSGGYGITIDSSNNLYAADTSLGQIAKITPGGVVSPYGTASDPRGLTFDTNGNLYVVRGGTIGVIAPGGGAATTYATLTGHTNLYGLAFDSAGYLYVSDLTSTALFKVAPGGGSFSNFGNLSSGPIGLAFDHNGLLYAAQPNDNKISTLSTDGTASTFANVGNSTELSSVQIRPGRGDAHRKLRHADPRRHRQLHGLPQRPSLSGDNLAFIGKGNGGAQGVYARIGAISPPQRIADTNTPIPGGTGNFTSFIPGNPVAPAISGDSVAFWGAGSGGAQGIYARVGAISPPQVVADTSTPIPGGTGNFTSFVPGNPVAPAISGDSVAFWGAGSGAQGIYERVGAISPPQLVADTNTAIPGGTGNFTAFPSAPSISSDNVAFIGTGSGIAQGVYAKIGAISPPQRIADTSTAIPGGTGNFTSFIPQEPFAPAISGDSVAFWGAGSGGQQGVYAGVPGNPVRVADTATAIPGGTGNFTSFGGVSLSATDVAFLGTGASGQQGIYDMTGGSLLKVVNLNDIIDGRSITGLQLAATGLSGDPIAFQATFADGSQGIYMWSLPLVAGDFNRDGVLSAADIQAMLVALTDLNAYASAKSLSPTQLAAIGDFDSSGTVTNRDIQGLLDLVASQGGGSAESVPEPADMTLLLIGVAVGFAGTATSRREAC